MKQRQSYLVVIAALAVAFANLTVAGDKKPAATPTAKLAAGKVAIPAASPAKTDPAKPAARTTDPDLALLTDELAPSQPNMTRRTDPDPCPGGPFQCTIYGVCNNVLKPCKESTSGCGSSSNFGQASCSLPGGSVFSCPSGKTIRYQTCPCTVCNGAVTCASSYTRLYCE